MKRKDSKGRILKTGEYERSDGRYVFRFVDIKGKPKFIYSWRLVETDIQPKDKPRSESLREMEKVVLKDISDGIVAHSKITLNTRWDEYIANKPELKQSTSTNYKYMYNKYIRDDIGDMPIKSVTYSICKKLLNKLISNGFKPNSVEIINTILHPVFTIAIKDGLLRTNPMEGIIADLKRSNGWEKNKRHALTKEQQIAFIDFVKDHPVFSRWHPIIICMLGTGCRIAEMLGLRWQDVFWQDNIISINHNLIYHLQDDGSVQFRVTTTKTKNGKRDIPMFENVKQALKKEYSRQEKEGFCTQEVDGYSGFIWTNRFGNLLSPACFNRALVRITNDYNSQETTLAKKEKRKPNLLPHFSAHHLRHTFCVRLCEEVTDLKLIQEIMGHSDISTTMNIYNESNIERKKKKFADLEKVSQVF